MEDAPLRSSPRPHGIVFFEGESKWAGSPQFSLALSTGDHESNGFVSRAVCVAAGEEMTGESSLQLLQSDAFVPVQENGPERAADLALAQRAAKGDVQAFEEIYRVHQRRVYGLCLRMTQNVAEAEDITQEVFILLHRKAGSFRGESQFNTWLYRLTVNQVLMRFRKTKARREEALEGVEARPVETFVAGRPGAAQLIDRMALDSALAQLPPG